MCRLYTLRRENAYSADVKLAYNFPVEHRMVKRRGGRDKNQIMPDITQSTIMSLFPAELLCRMTVFAVRKVQNRRR